MDKNQDPGFGIRDKHPESATLLSAVPNFFYRFYDGAGPRQGVRFGKGEEEQEGVEARLGRGGQVQGVREETTGQFHLENEHALQAFAQL
jgi:hypothetical protein